MPSHSKNKQMADLSYLGIQNPANLYWNLSPEELTKHTLDNNQGTTKRHRGARRHDRRVYRSISKRQIYR